MNASAPPARAPLMALDAALADLLARVVPLAGVEAVATFEADGRVLASDLV
ncbi:MAG: molybdopterin molybdenumtransferase MoeA, partial [Hydrogenophaga sp.]|nr:molybdopterin molybdenumtransferase MoeA [Hydrogenophaga sp.]